MASNLVQATPFFAVAAIEAAVEFYRDILGFTPRSVGGGYAYCEREGAAVRLLQQSAGAPGTAGTGHGYIDVRDIDALFAELAPRLAKIPQERWHAPCNMPHLQREFWVRDPSGNLLTFGQGIGPNEGQWD